MKYVRNDVSVSMAMEKGHVVFIHAFAPGDRVPGRLWLCWCGRVWYESRSAPVIMCDEYPACSLSLHTDVIVVR